MTSKTYLVSDTTTTKNDLDNNAYTFVYWLLDSNNATKAYGVHFNYNGKTSFKTNACAVSGNDVTKGIRPVITLTKEVVSYAFIKKSNSSDLR